MVGNRFIKLFGVVVNPDFVWKYAIIVLVFVAICIAIGEITQQYINCLGKCILF